MGHIWGYIGALTVVCIWGSTFVSSKVLLDAEMQPADIFFIRFVIAYLCMLVISHRRLFADDWHDELVFFLLGILGGSLYFLTENMALCHSYATNVSILVSTAPLLTALVCSIFYRSERMTGKQVIGSLIAFVGVVLVISDAYLCRILHGYAIRVIVNGNDHADGLAFAVCDSCQFPGHRSTGFYSTVICFFTDQLINNSHFYKPPKKMHTPQCEFIIV